MIANPHDSPTAAVRNQVLHRRQEFSDGERAVLSAQIGLAWLKSFQSSPRRAKNVALYRALPDELRLTVIEDYFRKEGATLHFPRVSPGPERHMEFAAVSPDDSHWDQGLYGIQQPHTSMKATDPAELDLIFMPGLAFGESGERIGMGKGYFDRFLPKSPKALRVALVFDFQLYKTLEQQPWDQRVHWILTEKREIKLPFAESWMT